MVLFNNLFCVDFFYGLTINIDNTDDISLLNSSETLITFTMLLCDYNTKH